MIEKRPRKQTTGDLHAPAAATAAVITYAAETGRQHVIGGIWYSYSAAPTGGRLTIEDGAGTVVFDLTITAAGPGSVSFDAPLCGSPGVALVITLASGAGAVVGKLNAQHWLE
jgi:hypothetical protein